jgi:S1-C subfamily serine protease
VLPGSATAKAGLKVGDRLMTMDDRWTDSVSDCFTAASYVKPGTKVRITIQRDGQEQKLSVQPQSGL